MPEPARPQPISLRARAAEVAGDVRGEAEERCLATFRRVVMASRGNPDAPGMAQLATALLDLVEEHLRGEIEENVSWATPRAESMRAAFEALFLTALQAALETLQEAGDPDDPKEAGDDEGR